MFLIVGSILRKFVQQNCLGKYLLLETKLRIYLFPILDGHRDMVDFHPGILLKDQKFEGPFCRVFLSNLRTKAR